MALSKETYTDATHKFTKWRKLPYDVNILDPQLTAEQINSIQDEIIANAAAIAGVTAGAVPAGSVTNAMMATDVKIGSNATLKTAEKGTVVGAVNEIYDSIQDVVTEDGTQTLTEKTLTSPVLTTPLIADGDAGLTLTSADQTHASATITFPNCGDAADTVVLADTAQTLTNKTLTLPKIATTGAIVDAGGDEYLKFVEATTPVTYVQITSGDTTVAPKVQGAGETNTDLHLLGSGTGNVKLSDGTDPTKLMVFELGGATTKKTATITSSHTDDRTITLPDATDTLVGKATTDTMTNKTLTTPIIASLYQDAGKTKLMTVPDTASDTLCAIAATQALTNKTLTDAAQTWTLGAHDYDGAAADWTLSAAELLKPCHKPTNANSAVNAIVATTIRPYFFINATGQALTVKTAAGTGIAIANGKSAFVMSDGTNVIRMTADA